MKSMYDQFVSFACLNFMFVGLIFFVNLLQYTVYIFYKIACMHMEAKYVITGLLLAFFCITFFLLSLHAPSEYYVLIFL